MIMDSRVMRVWPAAPEGQTYVRQTLAGGEYISTGVFPRNKVDHKGRGRSVDNCSAVTSLMFDLDLLPLYDAARQAKGAVLEMRAQDRKLRLYAENPAMVRAFKELLREEFLSVLEDVVGEPPTLIVDSGWGYHAHYAVDPEMQEQKEALRTVCAAVIDECNRRCHDRGKTLQPPVDMPAAFDKTFDVGARLARMPGSRNTKAPGNPRKVEVIHSSKTVLDHRLLLALQEEYLRDGQTPDHGEDFKVPRPARPKQARRVDCDFRAMHLADGRAWQTIASSLAPGERTKVVCPFGGSSVGSGFFAAEPDGRVRYYSSPTDTTYWNTYVAPKRSGLADLMRGPSKRGQPGEVLKSVVNLTRMLRDDGGYDLWYDEFRQREMDGQDAVTDTLWIHVMEHMESTYAWSWRPSQQMIWGAIEKVCRERSRNPLCEYLNTLQWDGQPRIDRWITEVCRVEDNATMRAYSRRWVIGLLARAFKPGCKLDTSLVISGPQGFGKSTMFREWVTLPGLDDLFVDTKIDLRNKDAYLTLHTCWIYEDAELAGQSASDTESRKAFLSSQVDRLRPPFGRKMREYKRHTVIVGTTNEDEFLKDRTGDRRYWVVRVTDPRGADMQWLREHRNQMLAEARVALEAGEQWWLTQNEDRLRALNNKQFQSIDWYTECAITGFVANGGGKRNGITVAQFARAVDPNLSVQSRSVSLSAALLRAGWRKWRSNGVTYYFKDTEQKHTDNGIKAIKALMGEANIRARLAKIG